MISIEKILENKNNIVEALHSWADTFIDEKDEDNEPTSNSYNYIIRLAENLTNSTCNAIDFEDIRFHIWQINYNEDILIL